MDYFDDSAAGDVADVVYRQALDAWSHAGADWLCGPLDNPLWELLDGLRGYFKQSAVRQVPDRVLAQLPEPSRPKVFQGRARRLRDDAIASAAREASVRPPGRGRYRRVTRPHRGPAHAGKSTRR